MNVSVLWYKQDGRCRAREKSKLRTMRRSWVFLLLFECSTSSRVLISQHTDISDRFILLWSNICHAFVWAMSLSSDINMVASQSACALYLKYLIIPFEIFHHKMEHCLDQYRKVPKGLPLQVYGHERGQPISQVVLNPSTPFLPCGRHFMLYWHCTAHACQSPAMTDCIWSHMNNGGKSNDLEFCFWKLVSI